MAKRFFYVCAGILMLALSYHFGARSASAQIDKKDQKVAAAMYNPATQEMIVLTPSGDIYARSSYGNGEKAHFIRNFWQY
jgi:hypothetical protein